MKGAFTVTSPPQNVVWHLELLTVDCSPYRALQSGLAVLPSAAFRGCQKVGEACLSDEQPFWPVSSHATSKGLESAEVTCAGQPKGDRMQFSSSLPEP